MKFSRGYLYINFKKIGRIDGFVVESDRKIGNIKDRNTYITKVKNGATYSVRIVTYDFFRPIKNILIKMGVMKNVK